MFGLKYESDLLFIPFPKTLAKDGTIFDLGTNKNQ